MKPSPRKHIPANSIMERQSANLQELATVVRERPGLCLAEYGPLLLGRVSWTRPADNIRRIANSGTNQLGKHGIVLRDGRLWGRDG